MKLLVLVFIPIVVSFCSRSQEMVEIERMYVYNYFQIRGYSTAGARTQFDDLVKMNVEKIEVQQEDLRQINAIFKKIKSRHHNQTKLGIENVFIELNVEGKILKIVFGSPDFIVDLSNNQEYLIKDKEHKKWIMQFINKLKNAQ